MVKTVKNTWPNVIHLQNLTRPVKLEGGLKYVKEFFMK